MTAMQTASRGEKVARDRSADRLIRRISPFRDSPLDPAVRRATELCLLDSLSCYSAGRSLDHFGPIARVVGHLFGDVGTSRYSPFLCAYLYGEAANLLDYDDTLFFGHPGAAIVGSVLSVAAERQLPVEQLLRGIAAGYEAEMLLSMAAAPSAGRAALVRSVGVWDAMAASIGIAVALGFDDKLIDRSIGLAVPHSLLPYTAKWYERPVPSIKNNLGWAAAGAVLATELALAGKTGVANPLEGETGMWRMAGSDQWNFDNAPTGAAAVQRTGFKEYPVCWHLQEYLKCLAGLLGSIPQGDGIAEITLRAEPAMERFCMDRIMSPTDVAFSLPAAFSLMIARIDPGPRWAAFGEGDEPLRHRKLFRFERSETPGLLVVTESGVRLQAAVAASDHRNLAMRGLDETGVLTKHQRLAETALRIAAATALSPSGDPQPLYDAFHAGIDELHAGDAPAVPRARSADLQPASS